MMTGVGVLIMLLVIGCVHVLAHPQYVVETIDGNYFLLNKKITDPNLGVGSGNNTNKNIYKDFGKVSEKKGVEEKREQKNEDSDRNNKFGEGELKDNRNGEDKGSAEVFEEQVFERNSIDSVEESGQKENDEQKESFSGGEGKTKYKVFYGSGSGEDGDQKDNGSSEKGDQKDNGSSEKSEQKANGSGEEGQQENNEENDEQKESFSGSEGKTKYKVFYGSGEDGDQQDNGTIETGEQHDYDSGEEGEQKYDGSGEESEGEKDGSGKKGEQENNGSGSKDESVQTESGDAIVTYDYHYIS